MEPTSSSISRRDFVRSGGAALGAAAGAFPIARGAAAAGEAPAIAKVPRAVLGRTGVEVSRLGIGCAYFMRKRITPDDVAATLHRAVELGVDYLDTAPTYGDENSGFAEVKMGPVMKEIRDKVFLVTKTEEPSYDGTWKLLRQSLKRMNTDRLDLVHLHNFGDEKMWGDAKDVFGDKGAMAALREAKKQGVVRFIGASGHLHPTRFHEALDSGEIDVLMNAVNFVVQHTYDFEHKVWSRARHMNLGLVAMKVLGGAAKPDGGFKMDEAHYEQAVRYALSIPGLAVAVMGLENVAELERAASVVASARPLSPEESQELARVGLQLAGTPAWKTAYGEPLA